MKSLVWVLCCLACEPAKSYATVESSTTSQAIGTGCFDPAAYGAIPSDGISDRPALQAAADAAMAAGGAQTVCLGPGIWDCSKAPLGSYNRAACVSVHSGTITFAGAGTAFTTMRLAGDQGNADIVMVSHDPGSAGGVQDMTFETSDATNTSEQTHAMGTTGLCSPGNCKPIGPLLYQRLVIHHPRPADGRRKGDGIRLLGDSPAVAIHGVVIANVAFTSCARSCIQPQRGVHGLVIRDSEFWAQQPIHGESSGGSVPLEDEDADIYSNTFHTTELDGAPLPTDYDIALSGPPGSGPYDRIRIHSNVGSRGYYLYRTSNLEIYDTFISVNMHTPGGVIEVGNRCDSTSIHGVTLQRSGVAGPLIRLTTRDASACSNARVADSVLVQNTQGHGIHAESVDGLQVERVTMVWGVPAPDHAGVWHRATTVRINSMTVHDSWMAGPVGTAVTLSSTPGGIGIAHVIDNRARGNVAGLRCLGNAVTSVEYTLNQLGSVSCPYVLP